MPLVTNKWVSTDSNSRSNVPRGKKMVAQLSRCLFSQRVHTFSSGSAQRRRCETADLSPGSSIQIPAWPVLQTRPKSRSEFHRRINNVMSRWCVNKYGGSAARRRPNRSITSPYDYESNVDSTSRQPLKADCSFPSSELSLNLRPRCFSRF